MESNAEAEDAEKLDEVVACESRKKVGLWMEVL